MKRPLYIRHGANVEEERSGRKGGQGVNEKKKKTTN